MKREVKVERTNQARVSVTSIGMGRDLFRYAFLAKDYVEGRLKSSLGLKDRTGTKDPSTKDQDRRQIGLREHLMSERGDVPGWVLVVLMTTGLVTAIWAVAAPKLNAILKNSLDSMNNIR